MNNTEAKLLTAVLKDKQIHVLLQANVDNLLRTHGDIWNFVRLYFENNSVLPPAELVTEKFRDFEPVSGVGATKHHLEDLRKLLTLSSNSVIIYETGKLTHMRGGEFKTRRRKNLTMLGVAKQQ